MKITLLLTSIIATVLFASCGTTLYLAPLPKGHVGIHVKYKDFSKDDYDKLRPLVKDMADEHSADTRLDNYSNSAWFTDGAKTYGFVDLVYKPDHAIPAQGIEESMRKRLSMFLRKRKIAPESTTLELLYSGEEKINSSDGGRSYKLVRSAD